MSALDASEPAVTTARAAERFPPRAVSLPRVRPAAPTGALAWTKANLFSSVGSGTLTILIVLLLVWTVPPLVKFLLIDAVWSGTDREACLPSAARPEVGACWAFLGDRLAYVIYGSYPIAERWRVDLFFAALAFGTAWLLWLDAPRRDLGAWYFFAALPIVSFILLHGFPPLGLATIDTALWGGMMVTVVVAAVGIVVSLPIGVVLALGRRSNLPVVRLLSTLFIEFVRGVPLITVLFMAGVMLPLFVPDAWSPDKLVRALVGVALFSSAYMAEVVRAGLQSVGRGQYEAAHALGLTYWQSLRFIILPQALKVTIPNIVNSYISLFKDTTLVFFVGIFDFLKTVETAAADPKWATPVTTATGYAFAAMIYFVCCYAMSRYARRIELRVAAGERR
jgi:general L-amino acid transport system permease protein